ncbi:hypothetical protein [Pseudoalteromonas sp. BDTF-M6]|uniref:hypothetical protein n=1 Tax=Pseudoalteromonas sp. BDTF-M6 TaxID=2796132 RepID=UPI001BB05120|nr:hypothetical protein [Pseudoalteromonas sp. BDTF-M6]MBS3798589.1 hypothetical protein [Pseudoalteromonas sp. BDTF-M6]
MVVDPNLVGRYLEDILKAHPQRTANYSSIAQAFGLPDFDGAWSSHPLSEIFEVLDQQDSDADRPFRTSVVIGVNSNSPGPGFFEAMQRLKGIQEPRTRNSREQLWLTELNKAYAYPWA